jgi:hypothetical protein
MKQRGRRINVEDEPTRRTNLLPKDAFIWISSKKKVRRAQVLGPDYPGAKAPRDPPTFEARPFLSVMGGKGKYDSSPTDMEDRRV